MPYKFICRNEHCPDKDKEVLVHRITFNIKEGRTFYKEGFCPKCGNEMEYIEENKGIGTNFKSTNPNYIKKIGKDKPGKDVTYY